MLHRLDILNIILFSIQIKIIAIISGLKEREKYAPKKHLQETVEEMKKFNARRRLKVSLKKKRERRL
jgi:hypothetical protein